MAGLLLTSFSTPSIYADNEKVNETKIGIEQAVKEQVKIKGEILDLHEEIEQLDIQLIDVWELIKDYDEKLVNLNAHISTFNQEYTKQKEEVETLQSNMEELKKIQEQNMEYFKERAKVFHETSQDSNFLEVVLGSTSFGDFIHRVWSFNKISELDSETHENLENSYKKLKEYRGEVTTELTVLKEQKEQLEELNLHYLEIQAEKEHYLGQLEDEMKRKRTLLNDKKNQKNQAEQKEKQLKEELKNRERLLLQAKSDNEVVTTNNDNGMFVIPSKGRYSSPFGARWGRMHNGIDIATPIGTQVVAAAAGKVKWAQYVNGYGNTVLITHQINGKTYETLYAHLNSFKVKVGQEVSQGMVIAESGNTGASTGPHLHFEVHVGTWNSKKTNAIDPLSIL